MQSAGKVTVRSEMAIAEAVALWLFCLALIAILVASSSAWSVPLATALSLLLLWLACAWSLRRVVVDATAVTEIRFWPYRRSWSRDSVESLRLAPWDVGVIALPATRVEMEVTDGTIWFPTLQAWALTAPSRRRAIERVEVLGRYIGVPWTDTSTPE